MEDFFDKVLHYYGRKGEKLFMINIGAMDGVLFDGMSGYADMYNSDVLYVEPMKPHFDRLVKHKGGNSGNKFENSAISDYNGTINMKTIPIEIVDQGLVHQAFYGMSVIDPTKNGMGSEGDREVVEKYAVDVEVNCITWDTLVKKHDIDYFDVLSVDTEGHDYTIFKQIDLEKFRPILIRLEWCNMTDEEKTNILNKFTSSGYVYEILDNMDIDAVREDVYEEIKLKLEPKQIIETSNSKLTLVTGLWDIGRGDLQEGWSRSFQHYLDKFQQLLQVDVNMIIFGDKELEEFVLNNRSSENTQFVIRDLSWFKNNDFYDKIQKIRTNPDWYNQIGWLTNSTQAKLEMYNPLVMSKVYLLHDAKILDKFDSEYMFWIDAGLTNTIHPGYFTQDKVLNKLPQLVKNFHFVCFPYETNSEIHGFKYQELCDLAGKPVNMVARAGFFGGKKDVISEINSIYYGLMNDTLSQGLMGTEESLFTIMTYKYPNLITYSEIEGNGLMGKFFEDLKNMTVETKIKSNDVGLYVITFNSPKQFETLIESMLDYDPSFVTKTKKYLLNNSTDLTTTERYIQICDQYGFEHIKKDNIGITGGRQFIAEHFNEQNNLSHYYFFEDDMFFYNGGEITCKNGFVRKIKNIFDNTLKIIKEENFDFLKLNFSEFYGSHNKQWAWYNVPQSFRESHWPNNPKLPEHGLDANSPNLEFKHIKSYNGIPYATGEIYLCNWPIVMSKEGNYKCYLKTKYGMPYEQTLMSHCYQEMVKGNITGSVLLSTPTDHNRFDFYDGSLRKEC
jgi:FkbM family methyltransferase